MPSHNKSKYFRKHMALGVVSLITSTVSLACLMFYLNRQGQGCRLAGTELNDSKTRRLTHSVNSEKRIYRLFHYCVFCHIVCYDDYIVSERVCLSYWRSGTEDFERNDRSKQSMKWVVTPTRYNFELWQGDNYESCHIDESCRFGQAVIHVKEWLSCSFQNEWWWR